MRGFLEALRDHTCLDFLPGGRGHAGSPWLVFRWLPAVGMLMGLVVAWIQLPVAEYLLPPDAALMAALGIQTFLLNFGPEQALWRGLSRRPNSEGVATAALTLCLLAKFILYRQFLPPDISRVLVLGTTAAFTGPLLVAARVRPAPGADHLPAPPAGITILAVLFWTIVAALVAGTDRGWGPGFRTTISILAATALVQMIGAAWIRERHQGVPGPLFLMFSLPCEIAACAGLLMARSQFV